MIILIGVMEYVVFVILFGFELFMLFDFIGFELKGKSIQAGLPKCKNL